MLNIISWIILGLFLISSILYGFFYKKDKQNLATIVHCTILPLFGIFICTRLALHFPDSIHVFIITIISIIFVSLGIILANYKIVPKSKIVSQFLILASIFMWIQLYKSTFFIYRVAPAVLTIALLIYTGIIAAVLIFQKDWELKNVAKIVLAMGITAFLHFCALITMCVTWKLYSITLFLGSTAAFTMFILFILIFSKRKVKNEKVLNFIFTTVPHILISLSGALMICL